MTYPFTRGANPPPGEPQKVADGVYWARFAMPMSLDHINLWLLEDEDGWLYKKYERGVSTRFSGPYWSVTPTNLRKAYRLV